MDAHIVYLGIGGNLGDRAANLSRARRHIAERIGSVEAASALYRTAAWGIEDQPDFYNQVLRVRTHLEPEPLLDAILGIERDMGRVREKKWDRRLIDIDILFYDDRVIRTGRLAVPHPFLAERRFVLTPLAEIAPGLRHPALGETVAGLLRACTDPLPVVPVSENPPKE